MCQIKPKIYVSELLKHCDRWIDRFTNHRVKKLMNDHGKEYIERKAVLKADKANICATVSYSSAGSGWLEI